MTTLNDLDFEDWLEKESQAMNVLAEEGAADVAAPAAEAKRPSAAAVSGESTPAAGASAPETGAETLEAAKGPEPEKEPEPAEAPFAEPAFARAAEIPAPEEPPVRPQTTAILPDDIPHPQSTARRPGPAFEQEREQPREIRRPAQPQYSPQPPRREPPAPPQWDARWEEPPRRRGSILRWLIPVAAALMVLVASLAVCVSLAGRVAKLTTIYPNVSVNGVTVGGMTVEEAAQALGDPADRYENASVTVNFPTGDAVTVTAQDLGLKPLDGTGFAQLAYSYGRGGSMLSNWQTYRACQKQPVDLKAEMDQTSEPDTQFLNELVAPVVQRVNESLGTTEVNVGEDAITIVKNSGLTRVDAADVCAVILEAFEQEKYDPISYEVPDLSSQTQPGQTGSVDIGALLRQLYDEVYVEPVNAAYDPVTGGVTQAVQGLRFDMDEARRLWEQTAEGETVTIPLIREEPEITADQLSGELFSDVLAEKSTTLAGSSYARINNITLAAKAMNGTVIQPGEKFDYNTCLGERTTAKGYQSAGAYENGQHTTAIGGGICQGSSTLYYCTLYANLEILVRYDHYFTVNYLPLGMDATVSWGGPDFTFRNNRDFPIKLEAWVSNGYLTVRILGTDTDGSYVKITSDTWEDSQFYYAQTYRNVYDKNGALISSVKEASSRYHKAEAVTATAAPTAAPTEPPAPPVEQPPAEQPPVEVTTPEPTAPITPEPPPVQTETPVEPQPEQPPAEVPAPEAPPAETVPDAPAAPEGDGGSY